jgi:methyl-accepting chemotaxis protein
MQTWVQAFIIIAAVAIVLQMGILLALFLEVRALGRAISGAIADMQQRVNPILSRVHGILEESHERITSIVGDAAEMSRLARGQAQRLDRVLTEAADRLQQQVIRADQMVTGVMAVLEEAGSMARRTLITPVGQASAFIKGIKAGFETFRGRRRGRADLGATISASQDEELFI